MDEPRGAGGVARAIGMLFQPARTLDRIAEDLAEPKQLMLHYAAVLAAIPAVCGVAGARIFGLSIADVGLRVSLAGLILDAVVGYVLGLLAVWLLAKFVAVTAPAFGGVRRDRAALNLVVYAATAFWLSGLAGLYPSLVIPISVLAVLWSLYALFLGLTKLMDIPDDRRLTAFAAVLIAVVLLATGRGMITSKASDLGGPLRASYAPK